MFHLLRLHSNLVAHMHYKMSSRRVECLCCYTDSPRNQITLCNGLSPHGFCFSCVRSRIISSLDNNRIELGCIDTNGCTGEFVQSSLSTILDRDTLARFERVQANNFVRMAYGDSLVVCPFCSIQMIQDGRQEGDILICINPECSRPSCTKCRKDIHYPDPCDIVDRQRIRKEESDTYKIIKACPTCNVDIFKTDGCSHMKCANCDNTMCYICGVDITKDIWGHGCPVFSNGIVVEEESDDDSGDAEDNSSVDENDAESDGEMEQILVYAQGPRLQNNMPRMPEPLRNRQLPLNNQRPANNYAPQARMTYPVQQRPPVQQRQQTPIPQAGYNMNRQQGQLYDNVPVNTGRQQYPTGVQTRTIDYTYNMSGNHYQHPRPPVPQHNYYSPAPQYNYLNSRGSPHTINEDLARSAERYNRLVEISEKMDRLTDELEEATLRSEHNGRYGTNNYNQQSRRY
jgi:hypothetical protein